MLIAGRRLSDNPRGAFRAVTGLILALFVGSVSVGIIGTILDYKGTSDVSTPSRSTLVDEFQSFDNAGPQPVAGVQPTPAAVPAGLVAELGSIPGIRGVTVVYTEPGSSSDERGPSGTVLASCAELARAPRHSAAARPAPRSRR